MENKNTKLYLGLAALLIVLVGLFAYFYTPENGVNWSENYKQENKDPYGLHIARQLVAANQPTKKLTVIKGSLADGLPETTAQPANYVFMGASPYFDSSDVARLLAFVRKGNTAFLATKNLPKSLRDSIAKIYCKPILVDDRDYDSENSEAADENSDENPPEYIGDSNVDEEAKRMDSIVTVQRHLDSIAADEQAATVDPSYFDKNKKKKKKNNKETANYTEPSNDYEPTVHYNSDFFKQQNDDSTATFNFKNSKLKQKTPYSYTYKENYKGNEYSWYSINTTLFDADKKTTADVVTLGTMNKAEPCFIRIKYGKGTFLLHASPIVFTNYFLLHRPAVDYLQSTLSYLPEGDTYWDEPSKTYRDLTGDDNKWHPEVGMGYKGPFDYLLSQTALRWAFYLLWILAFFYLVFRAKRLQRAIPVLQENANTSLEYAENMGRLYYLHNDHKKLAEQKMKIFLHTLREKYNLPTHLSNEELIPRIVEKTGVFESIVRPIFSQNEFINYSGEISQNDLIEFHNYIEQFHFAAKK